jgi:hypothetical protein
MCSLPSIEVNDSSSNFIAGREDFHYFREDDSEGLSISVPAGTFFIRINAGGGRLYSRPYVLHVETSR